MSEGEATSKGKGKGKCKGKGKDGMEPQKPKVELSCEVKSLPWKRWQLGIELTDDTVWDRVGVQYSTEDLPKLVPVQDIEIRFAKTAGLQKVEKKDDVKKPKFAKLSSMIQSDRLHREVALKTLPGHLDTPQKVMLAICSLDADLLSSDAAKMLHRCLCPSEEQESEMRAQRHAGEEEYAQQLEAWHAAGSIRGQEPQAFQWDRVESFFEGLSVLPAVESRLSCWAFLSSLPEIMELLRGGLREFEAVVRCFRESRELAFLLGLVLAFGNTLNSGRNQQRLGQADGFHVEALGRPGGFDVVNDAHGKNIRQIIFETYFTKTPERAARFLGEFEPLFAIVKRRFGKTVPLCGDGITTFEKEVKVEIEQLDKSIEQLRGEWVRRNAELSNALQRIGADCGDPFVVEMPAAFERARVSLEELRAKKDDVMCQWKDLLKDFRAETFRGDPEVVDGKLQDGNPKEEMTSAVWCLLWDDFFVSANLMLEQPERLQKDVFTPRFCGVEPITIESLEMLWQLRKPVSLIDMAVKQRRGAQSKLQRASV